jgi:hypothetical protein
MGEGEGIEGKCNDINDVYLEEKKILCLGTRAQYGVICEARFAFHLPDIPAKTLKKRLPRCRVHIQIVHKNLFEEDADAIHITRYHSTTYPETPLLMNIVTLPSHRPFLFTHPLHTLSTTSKTTPSPTTRR